MGVDAIDPQLQGIISGAKLKAQQQAGQEDEADHARKVAEKKIALKKEALKSSAQNRTVFNQQSDLQNKMRQILGGAAGAEAAEQLGEWQNNGKLQGKLTEAQKSLFREAMAKNPEKGGQSAKAMNNIAKQPGFEQAVRNSQQMGTLQEGLIQNPRAEKPVSQMLQSRFMQAPKSDPQAKNQFLRFGLTQAGKGQMQSVQRAGDMLGTLTRIDIGKGAQRAAMNMVQRNPNDAAATKNLVDFPQHKDVAKMPSFARTKGTELLAKTNGKAEVQEGFEKLAGDANFRAQTAQNKGRFFSTIGTGRPGDFRAITDKALQALQNPSFPTRSAQVGRFLGKMSGAIQKGGAAAVKPEELIKQAKASALPSPPRLASTEGLDEEEAARVRSQNRAKVIQFFTKLQRSYDDGEKKLNSAKYLEDVNSLKNLRAAEEIDVSMLDAGEAAFVTAKKEVAAERLSRLRNLQRQRSRELRTKRMPPAKRRARTAARRAAGKQPKYFHPSVGPRSATQVFLENPGDNCPAPLPRNAGPAQLARSQARTSARDLGGSGSVEQQVASAMAELGDGPMTPQRAGRVAQIIAQRVAQQVTQQLLAGSAVSEKPMASPSAQNALKRGQQGKVDGWGIPRSFERELGGAQTDIVKAKGTDLEAPPTLEAVEQEVYKGRMIVKDASEIRQAQQLFETSWKQISKAEMALLRNLGWTQQTWDTKDTPAAKWPVTMATPFTSLNPTQRESVRKLGFSPHDWDARVQAFTMGKNA
jgi:hypothetical protein